MHAFVYVPECVRVCMYVYMYVWFTYIHITNSALGLVQTCQKAEPLITSVKIICIYCQEMTFRQVEAYSQILENIVLL